MRKKEEKKGREFIQGVFQRGEKTERKGLLSV
jgi:hypothetical protein